MTDVDDRIQKWQESTVAKAVKAAESALTKTLKKKNASITTPEALQQLQEVADSARDKAEKYFEKVSVPLCRLGSTTETSTARGKLMMDALKGKSLPSENCSKDVKFGFAAAMACSERDGVLKAKKKGIKKDKNSSSQGLLAIGKHMLK